MHPARDAPMMTEEDVVALIVERHHASAVELWVMREEWRQQSTDAQAQARVEVVENHLRHVWRRLTAVLCEHWTHKYDVHIQQRYQCFVWVQPYQWKYRVLTSEI